MEAVNKGQCYYHWCRNGPIHLFVKNTCSMIETYFFFNACPQYNFPVKRSQIVHVFFPFLLLHLFLFSKYKLSKYNAYKL